MDGRAFIVVDTGGLSPNEDDALAMLAEEQAQIALEEADHILFLVDTFDGCMPDDFAIAQRLRKLGKPLRRRIKLWLSEFTVATGPDREFNFHVSRATQARWITNALKVARSLPNVAGLGWIHLYDESPGPSISNGGLITYDGMRKPGYYAFKRG